MNPSRVERALIWCLWGFAFFLPISIALSEPLAYLAAPLTAWLFWKEGRRAAGAIPFRRPLWAFVSIAVLTLGWSIRPDVTLAKLDRFLLLSVIFALPLVGRASRKEALALAGKCALLFIIGASLQAASDLVLIPLAYLRESALHDAGVLAGTISRRAHRPTLFDMGNMRDPQMYMVSLSLLLGWFLYRKQTVDTRLWWVGMVLNVSAFVLHFKRGAWMAFLLSAGFMALASRRRRVVLVLLLAVLGTLAVPQVRDRLHQIRQQEFRVRTGGRYALWTRVASPMLADYPWGLGWKAARHEDFTRYEKSLQPKLNHLHNNVLQVRLETGWLGMAAWLAWMMSALVVMWRTYRRTLARHSPWEGLAFGGLCGFLSLQLNGLVEYNFGDAEIFMAMNFLLALAGLAWCANRDARSDAPATTAGPELRS